METKKENDMNQSMRKLHSHQEKEQNLLQQEAASFCSCPAQSLLKAAQTLSGSPLLCLVGDLLFIIVSYSLLCSILGQSSAHLSLLFGICVQEQCCGYRIVRITRIHQGSPLQHLTC